MPRIIVRAACVIGIALLISPAANAQASYSQEYRGWKTAYSSLTSLALSTPIGLTLLAYAQRLTLASPKSPDAREHVRAAATATSPTRSICESPEIAD